VLGRADAEIAQAIGTLVRRNADTNRRLQTKRVPSPSSSPSPDCFGHDTAPAGRS